MNAPANPNGIVTNAGVGQTWLDNVPEERERRARVAAPFVTVRTLVDDRDPANVIETVQAVPFEGGLEEMHARGLIDLEPIGDRVLVRSVMPEDADPRIKVPDFDGRRAIVAEIMAIGPGVADVMRARGYTDETTLRVGDLVWVLTTVADRIGRGKTIRTMTVPAQYLGVRVKLPAPPTP